MKKVTADELDECEDSHEALDVIRDRISEIQGFISNSDVESFFTESDSLRSIIEEANPIIPASFFVNDLFIELFKTMISSENCELKIRILQLLTQISDNVSSETDFSPFFQPFDDISEVINTFTQPVAEDSSEKNIEAFTCFIDLMRSFSENTSHEIFGPIAASVIPIIKIISQSFLTNNEAKSTLPTKIDYFLSLIYTVVYMKLDFDEDTEAAINEILVLYFNNIANFNKQSLLMNSLWYRISKFPDTASLFVNHDTQDVINQFFFVNVDEKESNKLTMSVIEVLSICMEKHQSEFFSMIDYPFNVLHEKCVYLLSNFSGDSYTKSDKLLISIFEFMGTTIYYNKEATSGFISENFIDDVIAPLYNEEFSFKLRKAGTEFFFNMLLSCSSWSDRCIFIESDIFAQSMCTLNSYSTSYIKKILNLFEFVLSEQGDRSDKSDINRASLKIREILDDCEVSSIIEEFASHTSKSISLHATTILDLISE